MPVKLNGQTIWLPNEKKPVKKAGGPNASQNASRNASDETLIQNEELLIEGAKE